MKSSASVIAGLLLAMVLSAQTTSTSILGTVTDPSGAAVANATVSALNVKTGIETKTVSTASGDYTIPLLDVGEYDVTVLSPGFKPETRKGVRLQVNEKVRADFQLQVGAQTERVTVSAEAVALRTDEASVGTVEQRRLVELPMN